MISRRILLLENDDSFIKITKSILFDIGHRVATAPLNSKASDSLLIQDPDLVITSNRNNKSVSQQRQLDFVRKEFRLAIAIANVTGGNNRIQLGSLLLPSNQVVEELVNPNLDLKTCIEIACCMAKLDNFHLKRFDSLNQEIDRHQSSLKGSGVGLWHRFCYDRNEEWWSPQFYHLLGLHNMEIQASASNFASFILQDDKSRVLEEISCHIERQASYETEFRIQPKNGAIKWVHYQANPHWDEYGKFQQLSGTLLDFSRFKSLEERYSLAMDATKDGIWDWDVATGEVIYNRNYASMLGYAQEEVETNAEFWLNLIHPHDRQKAFKANLDCIENRCDSFAVEFRMHTKNGKWKWILGRGQAVSRDEDGQAIRLVGTHVDITERKCMEQELAEHKAQLEEMMMQRTRELNATNTALSVLLKKFSNDRMELEDLILDNARKLVLPFLKKLKKSALDKEQRQFTETIENNLQYLTAPISQSPSLKNANLTPTELQIACLIKEGKSSKEIAEITTTKLRTVEFHRGNIRKKLGLNQRSDNLKTLLETMRE